MKSFLLRKLWPVLAGLLTAFAIMMVFEFVNSFMYPVPVDLDIYDNEALKAFTASLPWTAYVLVFIGWITGSFVGGYVATHLSKERVYRVALVLGVILTILGVINNLMIGHSILFNIIAWPMFILFTFVGNWVSRNQRKKR